MTPPLARVMGVGRQQQQEKKYLKLCDVRKLLLLSHGQATVKHSLSVNKDVSAQNISEHNLVARHIVEDHIHCVGRLRGVVTQCGCQRYHAYLEEKKDRVKRGINGTKEEEKDTTREIY